METELLNVVPVLPSADIPRDAAWYEKQAGFAVHFSDRMYAILVRENICIHLQWHADTPDDPLLGGSVIRIFVKSIRHIFDEFVKRGTVAPDSLKQNTPWNTHEFGFRDLNGNGIFVVEDIEPS